MDASLEEIDSYSRSIDNNYDSFIEMLANKRRTKQEALAGDVLTKAKPLEEAKRLHDEAVQAAALAEKQQQATATPLNTIVQVIKKTTETQPATIKPTLTTKQKPPVVAVQPIVQQVVPKSTTHDEYDDNVVGKQSDDYPEPRRANPLVASTVDDFVPDDNDYETFLVDDNTSPQQHLSVDPFAKSTTTTKLSTTDDENEFSVNPMVKGFREQLDSDDEQHQEPIITNDSTEYEPASPSTEIVLPPIFHQISSSDIDFLDQLSTSKVKQTNQESGTPDSQSIHSDSASTKPKKKKATSKSKKDETIPTADTTKTKKKKKTSKTTNLVTETANANNDEDDLESFLSDNPKTTRKTDHDYEHI
jgi:hypothetical protein